MLQGGRQESYYTENYVNVTIQGSKEYKKKKQGQITTAKSCKNKCSCPRNNPEEPGKKTRGTGNLSKN